MSWKTMVGIVLALCCVIYGIMVLCVGSGTGFYLVWFALAGLILLQVMVTRLSAGENIDVGNCNRWIVVLKRCLCVIWILMGMAIAVTWSMIATMFTAAGRPGLDYIIVLGAQVNQDGPSLSLRYRLDTARDYLQKNPGTVCVVSGGQGWNEPAPEAKVMKQYLVQQGVDEDRIIEEDTSRDTHENMENSAAIIRKLLLDQGLDRGQQATEQGIENRTELKDVSVGIVTNDFHVFRGVHVARHAGFTKAVGIAAPSTRLYLPNNMLRETLGIIKDFVCGNLA